MIQITFPPLMGLPPIGSTIEIQPLDNSIGATIGVVRPGNVVEIVNVFGESPNLSVATPRLIDILVVGTTNPPSATDAGGFQVTTWTQDCEGGECNFYLVDQGEMPNSFEATPGSIVSSGPMDVSDPITNYQDSTWTLTMIPGNTIPSGG